MQNYQEIIKYISTTCLYSNYFSNKKRNNPEFLMNHSDTGDNNLQKENAVKRPTKLGYKLTFYGLYGCISCAFLLPLLSHADRTHMFEEVEEIDYDTKEKYKEKVGSILEKYGKLTKNLPSPVILLQKEKDNIELLIEPDTVAECAVELTDTLNRLGDIAVMQYMDGELDHNILFNNLLLKLTTNIIFPLDFKRK